MSGSYTLRHGALRVESSTITWSLTAGVEPQRLGLAGGFADRF